MRQESYRKSWRRVSRGLARVRPDARLVPCFWGDALGARLALGGASIPRPDQNRSVPLGDDDALGPWAALDAEPLAEILALAALRRGSARRGYLPGRRGPWDDLADKVRSLDAAGLPDDVELSEDLAPHLGAAARTVAAEIARRLVGTDAPVDGASLAARAVVAVAIRLADGDVDGGTDEDTGGDTGGRVVGGTGSWGPASLGPDATAGLWGADGSADSGSADASADFGTADSWGAAADEPLPVDGADRDRLVDTLTDRLGGKDRGVLGRAADPLLWAGAGYVRVRGRETTTEGVVPAGGDILRYQVRGEALRERIAETVALTREQEPDRPVVLLAHSLGGIACFDLLAARAVPGVELLVTVGSQAPFLYEIDALQGLRRGDGLPEHFPRWLNAYDQRDLLGYVGAKVFPGRVTDVRVNLRQPFPRSHTGYFAHAPLYQRLAAELP
ncbi:hypothetical protein ACIGO8_22505 [Streptomyces sp. NPDC053493]|uniref:hypothetical protein n=1 Tax=Streptomyces sp. NPDC053493 TaxID=3365705 RepID=UPI0037D72DD0